MTKKKTISVERVREFANNFLEKSADTQTGERIGVSSFLETILNESGNHRGFNYIPKKGIIYDTVTGGMNHTFVDESRRRYY